MQLYDADEILAVKFDTEQLPPILNALETSNAGQKLVLEVAVRKIMPPCLATTILTQALSNIWEKT